jgi:hypothetical protein
LLKGLWELKEVGRLPEKVASPANPEESRSWSDHMGKENKGARSVLDSHTGRSRGAKLN